MFKTVTDYLDKTAETFPEKKAFFFDKREITFREIQSEAKKIAGEITRLGIFDKPICILMDKRAECICSMMGILYSGNFYTVLDADMPQARMNKILEVLNPCVLITCSEFKGMASELFEKNAFLKELMIYEDIISGSENDLEKTDAAIKKAYEKIDYNATMFVLFTSGSTGVPKGVIIQHKAFPAYLGWYRDTFNFDENTVFANQTPFYFIMSCPDIFLTIMLGASCHVVPKKSFSFPMVTLEYLKERRVNTLYWVPSVLCLIANFRALPELHLDDLKTVIFGGEVMPSKQLNMWKKEYPDVTFANLYGPTETTEMISYFMINREIKDDESLPIGIPASYIKVMLLDDNNEEVKDGGIGELCAAGISISPGYYNNPEKTKEVFALNPLYKDGDDPDTKNMYRTGDLARFDENGDLIYMGRKDFQIKHMGNRIELGEIETAVSAIDGVDSNCCLYDTKRSKIVLFYSGKISEDEINDKLKDLLPNYMIPNRIERLNKMPVNLNGKTDRTALKDMI